MKYWRLSMVDYCKKKYFFLINPKAGKRKVEQIKEIIKDEFNKRGIQYFICCEESMEAARRIIIEKAEEFHMVVSVGGDGTNYFVLNTLMETKQRNMGIIPVGTGNDYAKMLEIEGDFLTLVQGVINGTAHSTDIGLANDKYFLNIACMGFDAEVICHYDSLRRPNLGKVSYFYAILKAFITYRKKQFKLYLKNQVIENKFVLVAMGNGQYYGGGFPIMPEANPQDKRMDLITVERLSKIQLAIFFPLILIKKHVLLKKYVHTYQENYVKIEYQGTEALNLDGENIKTKSPIIFKLLSGEINLFY